MDPKKFRRWSPPTRLGSKLHRGYLTKAAESRALVPRQPGAGALETKPRSMMKPGGEESSPKIVGGRNLPALGPEHLRGTQFQGDAKRLHGRDIVHGARQPGPERAYARAVRGKPLPPHTPEAPSQAKEVAGADPKMITGGAPAGGRDGGKNGKNGAGGWDPKTVHMGKVHELKNGKKPESQHWLAKLGRKVEEWSKKRPESGPSIGPNILGAYHYGQAHGAATVSYLGGPAIGRLHIGRIMSGLHGLLNRKTPHHYESARAQREAQLQRQQGLRRMWGEGGGVTTTGGFPVAMGRGTGSRSGTGGARLGMFRSLEGVQNEGPALLIRIPSKRNRNG